MARKVSPEVEQKIMRLLATGMSVKDAAKICGITRDAIHKMIQDKGRILGMAEMTTDYSGRPIAHLEIDTRKNVSQQMWWINSKAIDLLKRAEESGDDDMVLRAATEIRRQMESIVKIRSQLYTLRDVMLFRETVLDAIQGVAPELRVKIEAEFSKRRALHMVGMDEE